MVRFQLRVPIFIRTFLRPLSPDPIFIRISEVTFCKKIPKFIRTALRHFAKKSQNLSKRVMRDLGVLSGVLIYFEIFLQNATSKIRIKIGSGDRGLKNVRIKIVGTQS